MLKSMVWTYASPKEERKIAHISKPKEIVIQKKEFIHNCRRLGISCMQVKSKELLPS